MMPVTERVKVKSGSLVAPSSTSPVRLQDRGPQLMAVDEVKCAVCEQRVIEGKDQALFCEGLCNGWYHRYCAGVSVPHFQRLSTSSEPFFCAECYQARCSDEIDEMKRTVCSLKDEIVCLREALEDKCKSCNYNSESASQCPTSTAAMDNNHPAEFGVSCLSRGGGRVGKSSGGRSRRGRGGGRVVANGVLSRDGERNSDLCDSQPNVMVNQETQKVCVKGVHRVWGTMSVTIITSLQCTITRFFPSVSLRVKRKTICDNAGKVKRWWFVLHSSEEALKSLEDKWNSIQMQTGWKLELCFRPIHGSPDENTATSVSFGVQPVDSSTAKESQNITTTSEQSMDSAEATATIDLSTAVPLSSPFLEN